jgi:hypothetical protein
MTIEREVEGLERDERALEIAANALKRLADVAEKFYAALYPEKRIVREATLTTVRTTEQENLAETIQGSESTLEQWKDIGPRERAFIEKEKLKKSS